MNYRLDTPFTFPPPPPRTKKKTQKKYTKKTKNNVQKGQPLLTLVFFCFKNDILSSLLSGSIPAIKWDRKW
jgi:hypothetical protein